MKTFKLVRNVDVSGVSGTGVVAEGVEFKNGKVALGWLGPHHTVELLESIQEVLDIHGHNGATTIEWDNNG